eukprot:1615954-Prymnesium_polylepis.1
MPETPQVAVTCLQSRNLLSCNLDSLFTAFAESNTSMENVIPEVPQKNGWNQPTAIGVCMVRTILRYGGAITPNIRIHIDIVRPVLPWNTSAERSALAMSVPLPSNVSAQPEADVKAGARPRSRPATARAAIVLRRRACGRLPA